MMCMLVFGLALCAPAVRSATYDAASGFSTTSNPAGPWSYGWSLQLTSAVDLYSGLFHDRGIDNWSDSGGLPPNVSHNGTASPISLSPEAITWQPGQLALHPGQYGEYSHVLWTAPFAGTYEISADFANIDHTGGSTDVHVLHDGSLLWSGAVVGYGGTASFSTTVTVAAGDIIDFAVGYGGGGWWQDTTALDATLSCGIELNVDPTELLWTEEDGAYAYDVVKGDLHVLRDSFGGFSLAVDECLDENISSTSTSHDGDPPGGEGFWYLVRGVSATGNLTYDSCGPAQAASRDDEIAASSESCM
jgi:hypothetical protein